MTSVTVTNPGFETGDLTGWTITAGSWTVATVEPFTGYPVQAGTYSLFVNTPGHNNPSMYQDIDLTSIFTDEELDARATFTATAYLRHTTGGDSDTAHIGIQFKDAGGTLIGVERSATESTNAWLLNTVTSTVPYGARSVRIRIYGTRAGAGSTVNAGYDSITLDITEGDPDAPWSGLTSVTGNTTDGTSGLFPDQYIGPIVDANTKILVAVSDYASTASGDISDVEMNGVSMTRVFGSSYGSSGHDAAFAWYIADHPNDSPEDTATFEVFHGGDTLSGWSLAVYQLNAATAWTLNGSGSNGASATSVSTTLDETDGDHIFAQTSDRDPDRHVCVGSRVATATAAGVTVTGTRDDFTAGVDYDGDVSIDGATSGSRIGISVMGLTPTPVATGAVVTDCTPASGAESGGTPVTITGSNFTAATDVTFDGVPALSGSFSVDSDTQITCDTPSGTAGAVDVVVQHPDGNGTLTNGFTYLGLAITDVSPAEGPAEGGTLVTITGSGFTDVDTVLFDGDAGTSLTIVNDTTLTVVTPSQSAVGLVSVIVSTPSPYDEYIAPYAFDYYSCVIDYIAPTEGAATVAVTIFGSGFTSATGVLFGGVPADDFVVVDAQTITCTVPEQSGLVLGFVDVEVQHPLGNFLEPYAYEYLIVTAEVSQVPVNVVYLPTQQGTVSQIPINVVFVPAKPGAVTQIPITVIFPLEPVPPDALLPVWPIEETWTWKTTVVKTLSGREQRMAVRIEPWQSYAYSLAIFNDVDRQSMLYTFWRNAGRRLNYPLFSYLVPIETAASIGETFLDVDTSAGNFRAGEAVAIFNVDLSFYHVLATDGFASPDGIVLTDALEVNVPAGTMIAPAPVCRIGDKNSMSMSTHNGSANVELTAVSTRAILRPGQSESIDTFDGLPIIYDKYISEGVEEMIDRNIESAENDITLPVDFPSWYFPQMNTSRAYLVEKEDLDTWRAFAKTILGAQGAFLVPSFREDFTLNAVPALNQTLLTTDDAYVSDYFKSYSNKYLRIETANGVIYRGVVDVFLNMDRTATVKLATALGNTTGDNVITKLSIVHKVRLADDMIRLSHMPNHVVVSMNLATVER